MSRRPLRLAALLVLVLVAGCRRGGDLDATFPGAPVILISIDTLRSDRLPAYGYGGVATPAIDALAADGVLYERAYTHVPLTLPAHASLLTGLLPTEHGVRDNQGYDLELGDDVPYLPRLLHDAGYATGAAVSAFVLRAATGLGAGFDFYEDSLEQGDAESIGEVQRPGQVTLDRTLDWLESVRDRPFFLLFHLYEPHTPYHPPEPFASRYDDPYDGEIAAADAVVGRLLDHLRRLGLYRRSIIVLLSDHGEGLGDHGEREHGILLYREALQVPLILKLPEARLAGRRSAHPAQLIDVVPTVLDLLGQPRPDRLAGSSLRALLAGEAPERALYAETYYPRLHMGWSELTSLIEGRLHYIAGPDPELYDLVADPAERRNVLAEERRALSRMRATLAGLQRELAAPSAVDAETAARLAALGYAGGGSLTPASGPLPDPKAEVHTLERLGKAHRHMGRGAYAEALQILRPLVEQNPRMADAWMAVGVCFKRLGRPRPAIEAYRQVAAIRGMRPNLALIIAELYRQSGDLEQARSHAELALAENPVDAHLQLSEVAREAGDLGAAERHARQALAARDGAVAPLVQLARIQILRGDLEAARQTVDRALAELRRDGAEPPPGLDFVRGDLLAREGRADEAVAAFRAEIERFPKNLDAHARLAFLLAVEGRPDEALQTLRAMVEHNDQPPAYAAAVKTLRGLGDERQAQALLDYARQRFPDAEVLAGL
ncbi:MAG: hypothetical protein D6696_06495 [Acidobacteria bacterium]|nr:MAG: hypothetical protein D6696_06495 [Acidobacteriota bacterium]